METLQIHHRAALISHRAALISLCAETISLVVAVIYLFNLYPKASAGVQAVREAERTKIELSRTARELSNLKEKNNASEAELQALTKKYKSCSNVTGTVVETPFSWATVGPVHLATADSLKVGLGSSEFRLHLVRVTNQGAVVRIEGCANPGIFEGRTSEEYGPNALVVPQGSEVHFQASTECCRKGLFDCDRADLEEFAIDCRKTDIPSNVAEIFVKRTLMGHAGS